MRILFLIFFTIITVTFCVENTTTTDIDDELIVELEIVKKTGTKIIADVHLPLNTTNKTTQNNLQSTVYDLVDLIKKYFHSILVFCIILMVLFLVYLSIVTICRSLRNSKSIYEKFNETARNRDSAHVDFLANDGSETIIATSIRILDDVNKETESKSKPEKRASKKKFFKFFTRDSQRKLVVNDNIIDNTHL